MARSRDQEKNEMADPDNDRRKSRESLGEEEKRRESGSTSMTVKKTMNGWRLRGMGVTVVRDLISLHDSEGGLQLSDILQRRESIVCSTDGGKWRIVDR